MDLGRKLVFLTPFCYMVAKSFAANVSIRRLFLNVGQHAAVEIAHIPCQLSFWLAFTTKRVRNPD